MQDAGLPPLQFQFTEFVTVTFLRTVSTGSEKTVEKITNLIKNNPEIQP